MKSIRASSDLSILQQVAIDNIKSQVKLKV